LAANTLLNADEEVVMEIKRHPYFAVKNTVMTSLAGFAPLAVVYLLVPSFESGLGSMLRTLAWIWAIGSLVGIAIVWYQFVNDIWLITTKRLIHSQRTSPINQQLSTTSLLKIEDVNIRQRGLLANQLNYGDVVCQTSAAESRFEFRGVSW
jgi:hypothetical protein